MTSHEHDHEHDRPNDSVSPDPEDITNFLSHRLSATTGELASTWAALQAMHRRAKTAETRVEELERLLQVLQQPTTGEPAAA